VILNQIIILSIRRTGEDGRDYEAAIPQSKSVRFYLADVSSVQLDVIYLLNSFGVLSRGSVVALSVAVIAKHLTSEKVSLMKRVVPQELVELCQQYAAVDDKVVAPAEPKETDDCSSEQEIIHQLALLN